jgi:hypothetical protein
MFGLIPIALKGFPLSRPWHRLGDGRITAGNRERAVFGDLRRAQEGETIVSRRIPRSQRRQAASSEQALCGAGLTPVQRIIVLTVVLLVVVVLVCSGQPVCDVLGLVVAAGAAAAQIGPWLNGQRPAATCAGGV